eukprot:GHVO01034319.1.p2 GENE.GHVO01034319.1~~GHVO01034319.1.p2  ORF type:complete len:242 (-),score=76.55 GHVO01034319.1:88-813(-)
MLFSQSITKATEKDEDIKKSAFGILDKLSQGRPAILGQTGEGQKSLATRVVEDLMRGIGLPIGSSSPSLTAEQVASQFLSSPLAPPRRVSEFVPNICTAECVESMKQACRGFPVTQTIAAEIREKMGEATGDAPPISAVCPRAETLQIPTASLLSTFSSSIGDRGGSNIVSSILSARKIGGTGVGQLLGGIRSATTDLFAPSGCCQEFGTGCYVDVDECEAVGFALCNGNVNAVLSEARAA